MDRTLGLVVPAYRPDVGRLRDYVVALDERLSPDAIRIELDAPRSGVVDQLADGPATVHTAERRRGKGAAVTDGFEALDTDVLAFADADASTPADSMADVVAPVLADEAALAVGSRRHPDATVRSHQTLVRRRMGDVFAALARLLLEVRLYDYQCGAKAISAEAWRQVRNHLFEPGFAWDVELVAVTAALDLPVVEVPIVWEDQPRSTVSPVRSSLAFARTLLAARHRAKLLADDPLHAAIDRHRETRPALVDRPGAGRVSDDRPPGRLEALSSGVRIGQFVSVGAMGAVVDTVVLVTLAEGLGVLPELATLVGIETAILVMFAVNERWTFAGEGDPGRRPLLGRLRRSHVVRAAGSLTQFGVFVLVYRGLFVPVTLGDVGLWGAVASAVGLGPGAFAGLDLWLLVAKGTGIGIGMVVNYVFESLFTWRVAEA